MQNRKFLIKYSASKIIRFILYTNTYSNQTAKLRSIVEEGSVLPLTRMREDHAHNTNVNDVKPIRIM